ncbi:MAG: competence protein ComEC, partial [Pseudonocardiales bacterium]|nr:competence protein ComEC [Pseudonocardiales bacterium]
MTPRGGGAPFPGRSGPGASGGRGGGGSGAPSRGRDEPDGRDAAAEVVSRPADLRLVPAAGAVWAVLLLGLGTGPGGAVAGSAAAALVLVAALRRRGRVSAVLVAAAGCALAAGVLVTASTLVLSGHPVRAAADRGAAATLHVVVRDDPHRVRLAGPGAAQVVVPATLTAA